jgi:hypothetical protein
MLAILRAASQDSSPPWPVEMCGRLHDAALGAIYYAKTKKGRKAPEAAKDESLIAKTIDLKEQNIYAVVLDSKRTILRDHDKAKVLCTHANKDEAYEWLDTWCDWPERSEAQVSKIAWLRETIDRDGATTLLHLNEYLNESMVGQVLTKFYEKHDSGQTASRHFVKTYGSWIDESTGFILQQYGGTSLHKNMTNLTFDQFKSIIVQVLVALAEGQELLHLKHHDVHLDNVFISYVAEETYEYNISGQSFKVPNHGILARIGDFGLASITDPESKTRFERVDMDMLDGGEVDWGRWSGTLEGQKSYDAVTFLSKFYMKEESSLCPDEHTEWARGLYKIIKDAYPIIECSSQGRPFRGKEGSASILELLGLTIFKDWRC